MAEGVETIFAGAIGNDSNNETNKNPSNTIDDDRFLYRYDYFVVPGSVVSIADITIFGINYQSWTITVEEGNIFYTVNSSGDIELLEVE